MKKIHVYSVLIISTILVLSFGCKKENDLRGACEEVTFEVNAFDLATTYLYKEGDIINRTQFPFSVSADEVYKNLNKNFLILDLRSKNAYDAAHIEGSEQIDLKKLWFHFNEAIQPFKYDKVVLVCYSGQSATYAATLLQLSGFTNVYALKYGMSSWDANTAKAKWLKKTGDKSTSDLQAGNRKPAKGTPEIKTNMVHGSQIVPERAQQVLRLDYKSGAINWPDYVEQFDKVYTIFYGNEKLFKQAQLDGANYFEKGSLVKSKQLTELPTNQQIVIISEDGHEGASLAAYLNLLGYKAKNLNYGLNTFMYTKLRSMNGSIFSNFSVKNLPTEKTDINAAPVAVVDEGGC